MANTAHTATDSNKDTKTQPKLLAAPKLTPATDIDKSETKKPAKPTKSHWIWYELSTLQFYGSMLAIFLAGAAFLGYNYYLLNPDFLNKINQVYKPVTVGNRTLYLNIETPDDNSLVYESSVVISGNTTPGSGVVISGAQENDTVTADDKGHFSKTVDLIPGINLIDITTFDNNGNVKAQTKLIYYSTEKLT